MKFFLLAVMTIVLLASCDEARIAGKDYGSIGYVYGDGNPFSTYILERAGDGSLASYYNSISQGPLEFATGSLDGDVYMWIDMNEYQADVDSVRVELKPDEATKDYVAKFTPNREYYTNTAILSDIDGVLIIEGVETIPQDGLIGMLELSYSLDDGSRVFDNYDIYKGDNVKSVILE